MSVEQEDVIDAIGVDKTGDTVVLTIFDHLEWDAASGHLLVLQNKINTYLAFVESGELLEQYPDAKGRSVRIDVVCKHQPSSTGREFLSRAESTINHAGFAFGWRILAV